MLCLKGRERYPFPLVFNNIDLKSNSLLTLILTVVTLVISFLSKEILNVEDLVYSNLAEQFSANQIIEIMALKEKWEWITYALIPLLLILKISIIAAILDVGCFFFDKEIKYKRLFNIVVKAEFIFLLVILTKTAWFYFFQQNYTLEDLQYFYPFSALTVIGYEGLPAWFIYPLQVVNIFEAAYWFILAYLIGKELKINTEKGLGIVASSYGTGLVIWVVGVMFFTLNMS